jgi:hypothetical protein
VAFDDATHANRDCAFRSGILVLSSFLACLTTSPSVGADPVAPMNAPGVSGGGRPTPTECVYSTSVWHVGKKTVVDRHKVRKPYAALDADERDPNDPRCTVCEADQVRINPAKLGLSGLPAFRVCHAYVDEVTAALKALAAEPDVRIISITGYRPGRTRGPVVGGMRTWFSNHSYGTAIDINASFNGLYDRCDVLRVSPSTIRRCHLRLGGRWDPKVNPRETIIEGGAIHREFTKFWRWGGAIRGATKDMMHFSITGH